MRSKVELEKINSISPSNHVLICFLHKHTDDDVFDDFLKITKHFSEIYKESPEVV